MRIQLFTMTVALLGASLATAGCMVEQAEQEDVAKAQEAITNGELDGDAHPGVVLFYAHDGFSGWRCSGTLLTPNVVLTAGHCTDGAIYAIVYNDADRTSFVAQPGFPWAGSNGSVATSIHTHPEYNSSSFVLHDAGALIIDPPINLDPSDYGTLAEVGSLDALKPGRRSSFTAVGYGLQRINPVFVESSLDRMRSTPHLLQINVPGFTGDFSLLLSNNHATGGTCFGDSGGPNFLADSNVVAGITSFGINGNCAGTGGVFRTDKQNVHDFVNGVITAAL